MLHQKSAEHARGLSIFTYYLFTKSKQPILDVIEVIEDYAEDTLGTALCPYCGIDSVIGESSDIQLHLNFCKE